MDIQPPGYPQGYAVVRLPLDQSRMGPPQYRVVRPDGSECCYGVSLESAEEAIEADRASTSTLTIRAMPAIPFQSAL